MKTQKTKTTASHAPNQPKAKPQPAVKDKPVARKPYTRKTKPSAPTSLQTISNAAKTPEYSPAIIKKLMEKLDLNEKGFAFVMNVSPMTVRFWTTGAVKPCSISKRLMQIFDASPNLAADIVAGREAINE